MKKILLTLAALAAFSATAQDTTTGRPGVAIAKTTATPALQKDMKDRGMETTLERVKQALDGHLAAAIQGSGKFTVLARGDELKGVLDDPSNLGDSFRLDKNDFAVFIKLDSYLDTKVQMPLDDMTLVKRILQVSGQVSIYGADSKAALDISNLQIQRFMVIGTDIQTAEVLDKMLPVITRVFAEQSYERLMDMTFPMRVLSARNGVITVNRGADFLSVGDVVDVFAEGESIEDEDTGEVIKIKGELLGTAKITSVEPKYSQAKANGAFTVEKGAEVRKQPKKADEQIK
ncbi:MAG: hypothetical protein FWF96_03585 [Kiritimatiellaeota bacterium]|nr:hypothetical protein [Kiritimatiellota bacterium]